MQEKSTLHGSGWFLMCSFECYSCIVASILRLFLGFKFLTRNEENNNFPSDERGNFEEFLHLNLEYISPVQIQL